MAITTKLTDTFMDELLEGRHQFRAGAGNTFNAVLIKSGMAGTYGTGTTNYTDITGNSDEVTGTGYTANNKVVTVASTYPKLETGSTFVVDFDDTSWTTATISAAGVAIVNTDATLGTANRVVAVYDFGGTVSSTAGTFTIQWAAPGASAGPIYFDRA